MHSNIHIHIYVSHIRIFQASYDTQSVQRGTKLYINTYAHKYTRMYIILTGLRLAPTQSVQRGTKLYINTCVHKYTRM
jgi:hypothetical protein